MLVKGTIRRRLNKDGTTSYVCQVKAGSDPATGKQRVLTGTAKSERAAHKLVHELVTKAASGEVQAADVTLNELIDRWLELGGPPEASTRVTYKGYIRNHVIGDIGRLKLSRLRAEDLDRWYSRLKAKGLAPASIRKCHVIVSGALSQGRRWGWVVANVAELASPPSVPKPVVRTPEPDQVRRMLATTAEVDPDFAVYIRLAAVTGDR